MDRVSRHGFTALSILVALGGCFSGGPEAASTSSGGPGGLAASSASSTAGASSGASGRSSGVTSGATLSGSAGTTLGTQGGRSSAGSSTGSFSTSVTSAGGSGGSSTSAASASSGATSAGSTTGGSSGATTGTTGGAGGDGGSCAATELFACKADSDCSCGQWCVFDTNDPGNNGVVCETPCVTDADCPNAVTTCTQVADSPHDAGKTCSVNACSDLDGPCDIGLPGAGGGTCVQLDFGSTASVQLGLCVPNGTATTCVQGTTNDDPLVVAPTIPVAVHEASSTNFVVTPQPKDPALFCGEGEGCYAPLAVALNVDDLTGTCEPLCAPGSTPCAAPAVCALQDPYNESWGFCLPCGNSGSDGGGAAECLSGGDCCEGNCQKLRGNQYGYCTQLGG